jgi:nucleoside-diphosphate-sugar epimerase
VGRHLLAKIGARTYDGIHCLSRWERTPAVPPCVGRKVKWVRGDLANPKTFERELARSDTVIHLAAITGKAHAEEYFRVNVEGTRTLVELCQQAGVKRFLHVSSIAVRYPDVSRYPYAQSKQQAEEIVRQSPLDYSVIRPTVIFGPESPAWQSLRKLAGLPVVPILGNGQARLQPIDVDDLVDFMVLLLQRDSFHRETLELGGPEVLTMEDLLRRIHRRMAGRPPQVVHLPPAAVLPLLAILEKIAYPLLPFTVGQFSPFRYNGTIETNALFEERRTKLKTIDEMLAGLCSHGPS